VRDAQPPQSVDASAPGSPRSSKTRSMSPSRATISRASSQVSMPRRARPRSRAARRPVRPERWRDRRRSISASAAQFCQKRRSDIGLLSKQRIGFPSARPASRTREATL
jgi:hypothetical protein